MDGITHLEDQWPNCGWYGDDWSAFVVYVCFCDGWNWLDVFLLEIERNEKLQKFWNSGISMYPVDKYKEFPETSVPGRPDTKDLQKIIETWFFFQSQESSVPSRPDTKNF